MNYNHRRSLSSSFTRAACGWWPALVLSVALPCKANVPTPPAPPPPPAGYCQTINTELTNYLTAFNATLSSLGNGSTYPTLYVGNLPSANGNVGPQLISSTQMYGVQSQLEELQAMGYQGVMMEIGFPVLYQPFYANQALYQQYVGFYAQVAATIRAMGMKIVVENDALLSSDIQAGWTTSTAYFASLNWTQYQAGRAKMAATIAQVVQPDYLVLAEEPDTESSQAGQPNLNIPGDAAAMISGEIAAVQALGLPNVQIGAGMGAWVQNLTTYLSDYVALPLNYIDFHVYPVNTENGKSLIGNSLIIASMAAAAGMPVAMSETWLWKMEDSEWGVLSADQFRSREPFSFWAPENTMFLQTMQNLANYTHMIYQAPSEPDYFYAYQTYGGTTANGGAANCMCTTASCSSNQIIQTETQLASAANAQSVFTTTGIGEYNLLVSPADSVPPSTPTNPTGNAVATTAYLSWGASTDNVGVAGYNVIRGGVWIANTNQTAYTDSGLATSTTYDYQIQAFDLAGNTSVSSTTLVLSTVYTIPPTAPGSVTATAYSPQGITVSWTAAQDPKGISSYQVFRGTSASGLAQVATASGTATSYKDTSLTASTTYYYAVEATQATYVSPMSAIASATTLALPSAPRNVVATPASSSQVSLTWAASSGGLPITSYFVFRGASPSTLSQIAARSTPSYTDNSLTPQTTYYYEVQANDSGGNTSPMSAVASATTLPSPNSPANLTATATSAVKIAWTWTDTVPANGLPIANYQVYCALTPASLIKVGTTLSASYNYTGLTAGTTYYCAVLAVDTAGGLSAMSTTGSATTVALPTAPANVVATPNSNNTNVAVTWTKTVVTGGLPIASYQIYRGTSPGNLSNVAARTTLSYTDTAVSPPVTYYYAIQATDTGGDASPMSPATQVFVP
jgi:fibronectin type 3 domain-containing protein